MTLLLSYLKAMDIADRVYFDLSLARGLDYYSGLIYEVIPQSNGQPSQVGSIAGGGRYDGLVGMYGKQPIPCVGLSFGVDRIHTILQARQAGNSSGSELTRELDVYIISLGGKDFDGHLLERMAVARQLWDAGIRAEFSAKIKPRSNQQLSASKDALLTVILGQDELAAGQVRLKVTRPGDIQAGDKEAAARDHGHLVSKEDIVKEVKLPASHQLTRPLRLEYYTTI